jgi:hypothetical protein
MRRGSPNPPKKISDAELESMRPHVIDEKLAERVEWVERIQREPDPGVGLPPKQAETVRQRQLNRLESAVAEVDRLRAALPPEPDQYPATRKKQRELNRRAIENAPRPEAERKAMREMQESMHKQQHEREAKSKLARLKDRRKHPPDPRASSVFAALVSSDWLAESLERKLRSGIRVFGDSGESMLRDDEYITSRILEASDIAVLFLASKAIAQGGLLSASTPADRGLHTLDDVAGSLSRLRRNDLLTVKGEGERTWRVGWGERAIRTARDAGVTPLPAVLTEPVEEILTRS